MEGKKELKKDCTLREHRSFKETENSDEIRYNLASAQLPILVKLNVFLPMKKVLVVCKENSCRSQMTEGYLKYYGKQRFEVYSAGLEVKEIHPLANKVMLEDGINISLHTINTLSDWQHFQFHYVISVCEEVELQLPPYLWHAKQIKWTLKDPTKIIGTESERLTNFRVLRDEIKSLSLLFIGQHFPLSTAAIY